MDDEVLVPISALQHYVYCPRQCALIHVEGIFLDSIDTLAGNLIHEHVNEMAKGVARGVRYEAALPVFSDRLGLTGRADIVEFRPEGPYPVEYKRGGAKAPLADEVQLCAQALCLEEMFAQPVPRGAIYRHKSRTRQEVALGEQLRSLTVETIEAVRALLGGQAMPQPAADQRCRKCSLLPACMPEALTDRERQEAHTNALYRFGEGESICDSGSTLCTS